METMTETKTIDWPTEFCEECKKPGTENLCARCQAFQSRRFVRKWMADLYDIHVISDGIEVDFENFENFLVDPNGSQLDRNHIQSICEKVILINSTIFEVAEVLGPLLNIDFHDEWSKKQDATEQLDH